MHLIRPKPLTPSRERWRLWKDDETAGDARHNLSREKIQNWSPFTVHVSIYINIRKIKFTSIYIYIHIHVCMYVCMYVRMYWLILLWIWSGDGITLQAMTFWRNCWTSYFLLLLLQGQLVLRQSLLHGEKRGERSAWALDLWLAVGGRERERESVCVCECVVWCVYYLHFLSVHPSTHLCVCVCIPKTHTTVIPS